MATTYCTPEEVATYCNLTDHSGDRVVFDENILNPTRLEMEDFINIAEEILDDRCTNAWGNRDVQVTNELHDLWCDYLECSLHLHYGNVLPFSNPDSDKIECFDGNAWIDWVATRTEGRGDDFFVDYKLGKIFFLRQRPRRGRQTIRITYRFQGSSTIPKAVKIATAFQVGILLANTENISLLFPTGESEDLSKGQLIGNWQKSINKFLEIYTTKPAPVATDFVPVRY